jgi:hypothetical protein
VVATGLTELAGRPVEVNHLNTFAANICHAGGAQRPVNFNTES